MRRPIAIATLLIAIAVPQTASTDDRAAPAEEGGRSWVQTLLPTLSLLGSG